jgi:hypothetical protein
MHYVTAREGRIMFWDNWLTIIAAAIAAFAVGGLWYGPLFSKAWMAENGFTEADLQGSNMALLFGGTIILNLVSAVFLGHLLAHFDPNPTQTMMISTGIALGFVIPSLAVNYMYSRKSMRLFLIDAGYFLAIFAVMGGVFVVLG